MDYECVYWLYLLFISFNFCRHIHVAANTMQKPVHRVYYYLFSYSVLLHHLQIFALYSWGNYLGRSFCNCYNDFIIYTRRVSKIKKSWCRIMEQRKEMNTNELKKSIYRLWMYHWGTKDKKTIRINHHLNKKQWLPDAAVISQQCIGSHCASCAWCEKQGGFIPRCK